MTATTSVLGGSIRRREDPALVRGKGRYTDDITMAGMLHVAFVRSPYAHARITSIDTSQAVAMEGVHTVFTGEDVRGLIPGRHECGAGYFARRRNSITSS